MEAVNYKNIYVFYTVDKFCCFGCAYGYLLKNSSSRYGDKLIANSIQWLKLMFELIYPDKILVHSPDWERHERNGGQMDDEAYYSVRYIYYSRSNIIVLPTKRECGVIPRDS